MEKAAGTAGRAFKSNLSRLRRLLAHDDALLVEGGRRTLNPTLCWVDVWSFERLLRRLQAALRGILPTDCVTLIAQTEMLRHLYQGEFLYREGCRPGALSLQEHLRTRRVNTLIEVGGCLEAARHWDRAAKLYRWVIEIEPLVEKSYRRVMTCLREQGESTEAALVYFRCCEALSAGLGTTPSRETEAIRRSLE